jgi:ribosomal protein L37AE/L43A
MILEYGEEQYKCLHRGWEKVFDGLEEYWKCTDCGATNEVPTDKKTKPTPLPDYMKSAMTKLKG